MGRISQLNSSTPNIPTPNVEFHEARENNEPNWQTRMHRVAVEIASTFFGQAMMMQFDKLLWTLEKTATWISNAKTDGRRAKAPATLIRPLPWVFFLPTLVVLRYTRVILSLLSICFGYDEIEASTMVTFLHQSRRTIRHIAHEGKRKQSKQLTKTQRQHSSMEYAKRIVLSFLSNLRNLVSFAPDTIKLHSNKTSLNAAVAGELVMHEQQQHRNDEVCRNSDSDSESDDQAYQDFLSRTIGTSDTSDDDFIAEMIGDESSDTDSQSSVASEDLSDDENIEKRRSPQVMLNSEKSTNGNAPENNGNYSASSSVAVDQIEIANADVNNDVQSPSSNNDDALNRLIEDTTEAGSNVPTSTRPIKNINRHHKNGRFHVKTKTNQNNGLLNKFSQGKRNHHVQSSANEFGTGLAAADHHA